MGTPKKKKKKKKKSQTPEYQFQFNLNLCSKTKDLQGAISLFESAMSSGTRLNQHHFNALLYLCSSSVSDQSLKELALNNGFSIFDRMLSTGVSPSEAAITAVVRLAAAKSDGDYAFELVRSMGKYNVVPRLRTYEPVLFCFVEKLEAEKAYEVEQHMVMVGVRLEEPEIAALLRVSSETGRGERVYEYLHKLRSSVRGVSESTVKIIEDWFCGKKACEVGKVNWDAEKIREAISRNGGGWHGQGWIGKREWVVRRGRVDSSGQCGCCGEKLFCVDIDDEETERFAQSVSFLAIEREIKSNFSEFQDWLEKNADYEAIVDGANVGLYQQNYADGGFSVSQLDAVVKKLRNKSGKKWPLVVLHNKRSRALLENPSTRDLVDEWIDKGILYTTPNGSNDDWYWLYATVKLRCLLVTNDEMRDHIFELLGSSFFLKWKERHQVRYTFVKGNLKLQMPPPYSSIIQESEKGAWHVPIADESNEESERTWLCITRPSVYEALDEALQMPIAASYPSGDSLRVQPCTSGSMATSINLQGNHDTFKTSDGKTTLVTGKRKERSCPSWVQRSF